LIVPDTTVPGSLVLELRAKLDLAEHQLGVKGGYPSPSDTVDFGSLSDQTVLPNFLDMRASDLGLEGWGCTNRIRQFLGVPFECRQRIASIYKHYGLLDQSSCSVLLRLPVKELDRMEQLWRVIEDGLFLSSPENFVKGHQEPVRRIFRWFVCTYVYEGHTAAVKRYKCFLQHVKQVGSNNQFGKLVQPEGFPWWDPVAKKLGKTGIYWLDLVMQRQVKTKSECTRFMHFVSLRGAPCPNRIKLASSLLEHQILRCTREQPTDPRRLQELFNIGVRIAARVGEKALLRHVLRTEHISVSNSSCYERSRAKGGRASYVQECVVQWLCHKPDTDCIQRLILGDEITVEAGVPYWKSFDPVEPISQREKEPDVVYGQVLPGGYLPKYAGISQNSGYQLLQWAFEEGVHRGVLDEHLNVVGVPSQRAVSLGEPGDKARSLTIDEAWLTLYLTPLGHILVDTLRAIPEVAAGLGTGQPAYHFVERLAKQASRDLDSRELFEYSWILTSDLDKATDHFSREKSRFLLRGYLHGLGKDYENPYCLSALALLTCERQCTWSLSSGKSGRKTADSSGGYYPPGDQSAEFFSTDLPHPGNGSSVSETNMD